MMERTLAPKLAEEAPEWAMLLPAGPEIVARDGRRWTFDAAELVAAFRKTAIALPVDWEHAQDKVATAGKAAPASGWIIDLESREGALWCKVQWTARAERRIVQREYRYLSASKLTDKNNRIVGLAGAGLINRPALHVLPILADQPAEEPAERAAALARLASEYQAEQAASGNAITIMEAVATVAERHPVRTATP